MGLLSEYNKVFKDLFLKTFSKDSLYLLKVLKFLKIKGIWKKDLNILYLFMNLLFIFIFNDKIFVFLI